MCESPNDVIALEAFEMFELTGATPVDALWGTPQTHYCFFVLQ